MSDVSGSGRLVCVGDVVIDITARVAALPERGGDVLAESGGVLAGGTGFNVMVAAARQGMSVAYGGAHGTGPFGDFARASMEREGIEVLLDAVPDVDTGWDIALTDAGSERTFITAVGAEAQLTRDRLDRVAVTGEDFVYVSGYGLLQDPGRSAIAGWLAALPAGATVLFDPGPLVADIPDDTMRAVLARTRWWSGNLAEASISTGEADARQAAMLLGAAHPGLGVVVRKGASGCVVVAPGVAADHEAVHVAGRVVEAVDSNGAGDAHVGAFLAALAAGHDPVAAADRANASAAIAVTRHGPATGPTSAELEAFLSGLAP